MKICSIAGQGGNGKTEVANYLGSILKKPWEKKSFGDEVKRIYMDTFGVDIEFVEKWKRSPEIPPGMLKTVRKSLQFIGDGFRQIDPEVWVKFLLKQLKEDQSIIIDDNRYFSETKMVKDKKGLTFLVWRPGKENSDPCPSESQIWPVVDFCIKNNIKDGIINRKFDPLCYFDFFIINDGSLEKLYQKIDSIVAPYVKEYYA